MGLFGYGATECFIYCSLKNSMAASISKQDSLRNSVLSSPPLRMTISDYGTDENEKRNNDGATNYKRPIHSEEFLRHLENVKSSWPCKNYDTYKDDIVDQKKFNSKSEYSVYCTGEPSIDPSRMLQSTSDDDHDWM